jgi:hypothetical protein
MRCSQAKPLQRVHLSLKAMVQHAIHEAVFPCLALLVARWSSFALESVLDFNTYIREHLYFLAAFTFAAKVDDNVAMDPNLDLDPETQSDELLPTAKLQAGYVRYIRIINEEGPEGEICFETCICRSQSDHYDGDDSPQSRSHSFTPRSLMHGIASASSHHIRAQATSCNKSISFPAARRITTQGASRLEE